MLDSLIIKNFRCLEDFSVDKLGRVNLIVGKNNSGKSTVLEALRLYAGNGQRHLLEAISIEHDERVQPGNTDADGPEPRSPYQDFFTGRKFPTDEGQAIEIGSAASAVDVLRIEHCFVVPVEELLSDGPTVETIIRLRRRRVSTAEANASSEEVSHALQINKGAKVFPFMLLDRPFNRARAPFYEAIASLPCSNVSTQLNTPDELADDWDRIALTPFEETVRKALQIIAPEFEKLNFVRSNERSVPTRSTMQRSARVKLANASAPVPLNSLGDGMLRVLQLALKFFPAKGGFLLIDEFENGLHYSVQERLWALVFEMAQRLDIQVFATTHSWDCIESF